MSDDTPDSSAVTAAPAIIPNPLLRLAVAGASGLFLELAVIRWAGSHVLYLSYVANLVLIGAFLGLGLGALFAGRVASRTVGRVVAVGPVLLALLIVVVALVEVQVVIAGGEVTYFQNERLGSVASSWLVLVILGLLFVALFATVGAAIGRDLCAATPLKAYSAEIGGSLAGIALFTLLAFLGTRAELWFALGGLGLLLLGTRSWRALMIGALPLFVATGVCAWVDAPSSWSPYQRVTVLASKQRSPRFAGDPAGGTPRYRLKVNSITHQHISDIRLREPFYEFPYRAVWRLPTARTDLRYLVDPQPPPATERERQRRRAVERRQRPLRRVLIVGAGNGTDVAFALAYGAQHVDAVEIDPLLAEIGQRLQPNKPYADPRVTLHIGDARTFIERAEQSYDLVVFGLPDSLTLASPHAGLRLESFLFTKEVFARVRSLLRPKTGLFVAYNYYRERWLLHRIRATIAAGFGSPVRVLVGPDRNLSAAFFAGPGLSRVPAGLGTSWGFRPLKAAAASGEGPGPGPLPSDDWPFLYMRQRGVPRHIVIASAVIIALALLAVLLLLRTTRAPEERRPERESRPTRESPSGESPDRSAPRRPLRLVAFVPFFLMGVAFLLLETSGLVRMSLLFGATWLVNALVFFAVLSMVLLANLIASKLSLRRPEPAFALLLGGLVLVWWLPADALASLPGAVRYVAAAVLLFVPVLLANLVFSRAFRETSDPALAFGANLVGAVVGGCLENLSLALGYRALFAVALLIYLLAFGSTYLAERPVERPVERPAER